jgi:hypothetical protein
MPSWAGRRFINFYTPHSRLYLQLWISPKKRVNPFFDYIVTESIATELSSFQQGKLLADANAGITAQVERIAQPCFDCFEGLHWDGVL